MSKFRSKSNWSADINHPVIRHLNRESGCILVYNMKIIHLIQMFHI